MYIHLSVNGQTNEDAHNHSLLKEQENPPEGTMKWTSAV